MLNVSHTQREVELATRTECPLNSDDRSSRPGQFLQPDQNPQQFFFIHHAAEAPPDHFVSSQRWLLTDPQADQHAGDDRTADLQFDAVLRMTQQMTTAQQALEETKEGLEYSAKVIQQRDDFGGNVRQIRRDAEESIIVLSRRSSARSTFRLVRLRFNNNQSHRMIRFASGVVAAQ